jgi:hypothetical protein
VADFYLPRFFVVAFSENKPPLKVVELKIFRYKYSSLWYNEDGPPTKNKIHKEE